MADRYQVGKLRDAEGVQQRSARRRSRRRSQVQVLETNIFPTPIIADRISALPNSVISHILSFLPTQQAIATSILSKRWKDIWKAISALNFDDGCYSKNEDTYLKFIPLVYNALLYRDREQTIEKFKLKCISPLCRTSVKAWVKAAHRCKVEHLNLSLPSTIKFPFSVFTSTTLVVLKLSGLYLQNNHSFVRVPSLKVLHLRMVCFLELEYIIQFLSGCPNLEVLVMKSLKSVGHRNTVGVKHYLRKLIKADVSESFIIFSFQLFNNVEFLRADLVPTTNKHISARNFSNLTYLELRLLCNDNWNLLIKLLHSCPHLQTLVIYKLMCTQDWVHPDCIPECLISKLRTFRFCEYGGKKDDLQFTRLVMQNARVLRKMTICCKTNSGPQEHLQMLRDFSSYPMVSSNCEIHLEW